jgi:predicted methyltransferase MtxX (methanogen marker protein 4)
MLSLKEQIFKLAKKRKRKVGIGLLNVSPSILDSLKRASEYADIIVIGQKVKGFKNIPANVKNLEEKEIEAILSKKIDGLIRGQADTYKFEDLLAKRRGYDRSKITGFTIMEDQVGRSFLISSGSHSDGWTIKSKKQMTDAMIKFVKQFKLKPKIGFLTWVRPGSVGRNFFLDQTWEQAENLVCYYEKKGYQAKNYNIEIETAIVDKCNIIVFATGPSGNIFNRAIAFFTKDPFIIYLHVGIKENIVENSRTQQDYFNNIITAVALANRK